MCQCGLELRRRQNAVVSSGIRDQDVHARKGIQFTTQFTCYAVSAVFAITFAVLVQTWMRAVYYSHFTCYASTKVQILIDVHLKYTHYI